MQHLTEQFGQIDIYLFDQLLRGRIQPGMRIFDAGCGGGRNLVYFLKNGYDLAGVDPDPDAIESTRKLAAWLAPKFPRDNFRTETIEATSFPESFADVVISSAVLHFARDEAHFDAMLQGTWRVLKPGGLFFCRLASSIGMQKHQLTPLGPKNRYRLPDGSDRYLVDEATLLRWNARLNAFPVDPIKTTIVQNERCMTTWVLNKTS
jgi:SAM-dependent methyltransferase